MNHPATLFAILAGAFAIVTVIAVAPPVVALLNGDMIGAVFMSLVDGAALIWVSREYISIYINHRKFLATLGPDVIAEIERMDRRMDRLMKQRPWEPIVFALNDVASEGDGFRFHATGVHRDRAFGFGVSFQRFQGPVALCVFSRTGEESDALLDIFAYYADTPRADSRFDETVRASSIILDALPQNVPVADARRFYTKFVFELSEDQPEIYMNFDFDAKSGRFEEKDCGYRSSLVHAFHESIEVDQPA